MSGSDGKCCRCCCNLIFTLGLTALFMWLSLRASNPKIYIQTLYLPSLNTTLKHPNDSTLNITLRLENPNKDKGIRYDTLNLTVSGFTNQSQVVSNFTMWGFYQGHKQKATKLGNGTASTTVASKAVNGSGIGVFRVDMATAVRFKIMFWYTKRHKIRVGANLTVNASGINVEHKKVRLNMAAPKMGSSSVVVGALVNFLIFSLINF